MEKKQHANVEKMAANHLANIGPVPGMHKERLKCNGESSAWCTSVVEVLRRLRWEECLKSMLKTQGDTQGGGMEVGRK